MPNLNLFYEHFKTLNTHTETQGTFKTSIKTWNSNKLQNSPSDNNELNHEISTTEIHNTIKQLKNNKSPGPDLVINEMIKAASDSIVPSLYYLFNKILSSSIYPESWTLGQIIPIFKSGVPTDPANYRGITTSNCIGKLFANIINKRITEHLTRFNIIRDEQIGFRQHFRTSDHIFVLKTLIDKYKLQKSIFTVVLSIFLAPLMLYGGRV